MSEGERIFVSNVSFNANKITKKKKKKREREIKEEEKRLFFSSEGDRNAPSSPRRL